MQEELTVYTATVAVPPGELYWHKPRQWCNEQCTKRWRYDGEGAFVFESEQDYVWFLLRWG